MRVMCTTFLVLAMSTVCAFAGGGSASGQALTDAERAKLKAQVEAAQKTKMQEAERAKADIKRTAIKQGQAVDQQAKQAGDKIDHDVNGLSWVYGSKAASLAGQAKKQQISAEAAAEKQRIAKEALKRAAEKDAQAKKGADSIVETVQGLKSQVGKDGKFGLQPKGSSLNVRNYGKN